MKPASPSDLRPEHKLLLCCARLRLDAQETSRLQELSQGDLNWDYVFRAAARHGLIALLYCHLPVACPGALPEWAMAHLRQFAVDNAGWSMLLTSELLNILALLEAQGISAIPFRGPTLAAFGYGNLALRQFSDLDLLIQRADFQKARAALASQGYRPIVPLTAAMEKFYLKSQYDYEFCDATNQFLVELHWEVSPQYLSRSLDAHIWWEGLEYRDLAGKKIPCLSPENLLLSICIHSTKHMWERLGWICDVATLVETHQELDWERIMAAGRQVGSERMILLGLCLAHDILKAPLPKEICQRFQTDLTMIGLAEQVRSRLFQNDYHWSDIFKTIPFHLKVKEHGRDKLLYCSHMLFTPSPADLTSWSLPPSLFFLYYLFRPFRLIENFVFNAEG